MLVDLFAEAAQAVERDIGDVFASRPDLDRAAQFMLASWCGRNGVSGTVNCSQGFAVRYTKDGGQPAVRWTNAVDSIPAWHRRLRTVTILHRDAFEVIERIEDAPGVCIYCDPPYIEKGAEYVHDLSADDHAKLAELLHRFKQTRVVLSYYDHPRLQDLSPDWTLRWLHATKSLVNQSRRDRGGATAAPEVLLINGESYAVKPGLFNGDGG